MPLIIHDPSRFPVLVTPVLPSVTFDDVSNISEHSIDSGKTALGSRSIFKVPVPKKGLGIKSMVMAMQFLLKDTDNAADYSTIKESDLVYWIKIFDHQQHAIVDMLGEAFFDGVHKYLQTRKEKNKYTDNFKHVAFKTEMSANSSASSDNLLIVNMDMPLPNQHTKDVDNAPPFFIKNTNGESEGDQFLHIQVTLRGSDRLDNLSSAKKALHRKLQAGVLSLDCRLIVDEWINTIPVGIDDYIDFRFRYVLEETVLTSTSNDIHLNYIITRKGGIGLCSLWLIDKTKALTNTLPHAIDGLIDVKLNAIEYIPKISITDYISSRNDQDGSNAIGLYNLSPTRLSDTGYTMAGDTELFKMLNSIGHTGKSDTETSIKIVCGLDNSVSGSRKFSLVSVIAIPV